MPSKARAGASSKTPIVASTTATITYAPHSGASASARRNCTHTAAAKTHAATARTAHASGVDNFTPLKSLDWQAHVYGEAAPEIQAVCAQRTLALHVFPWRLEMGRAGLRRNAVYLVRPDGYVALADPEHRASAITSYSQTRKLAR